MTAGGASANEREMRDRKIPRSDSESEAEAAIVYGGRAGSGGVAREMGEDDGAAEKEPERDVVGKRKEKEQRQAEGERWGGRLK